jgi:hypothetical protein
MSQTIDAIQARLTPSRAAVQAAESVKEATARSVKGVIAGRPIPVAFASVVAMALAVMTLKRSRANTTVSRTSGGHARHVGPLLAAVGAGIACWGAWNARRRLREVPGAPLPATWTEIEPVIDEPF